MEYNKELNIYQRLIKVMGEIAYIQKTATIEINNGKSYKAVTHDEVTARVRDHLMNNGVYSHPVTIVRATEPVTMTKEYNGKRSESVNFYTQADLVYRFLNVDNPSDFVDVPSIGDGIDPQDKSAGKAYSLAVKNAILKALMIETGENEESRVDGEIAANPVDKSGNRAVDKWIDNKAIDLQAATSIATLDRAWDAVISSPQYAKASEMQQGLLQDAAFSARVRFHQEESMYAVNDATDLDELKAALETAWAYAKAHTMGKANFEPIQTAYNKRKLVLEDNTPDFARQ